MSAPSGTLVSTSSGKLYRMLSDIFERSPTECQVDIAFRHEGGKQINARRTSLLGYLESQNMKTGKAIASALQQVTTGRSGEGLLFLIAGKGAQNKDRLVLSRFPADTGVMAELGDEGLDVSFVERIFMKNATSYKAVMYEGTSQKSGIWFGKAVDKQINATAADVSEYWIKDFLMSDFRTTSAHGSRRLAVAFRSATAAATLPVKTELIHAASLIKKFAGKSTTPAAIADEFGLSDGAVAELKKLMPGHVFTESFKFDHQEFQTLAAFRTDTLHNGALLTAPADQFDAIFEQKVADGADGIKRYTTEGKLVGQKLRKVGP